MRLGYRLCLAAGRLDAERALRELTPEQMDYWVAYDQVEPFGDHRLGRMFAVLLSMLRSALGGKDGSSLEPRDFVAVFEDGPDWGDAASESDSQDAYELQAQSEVELIRQFASRRNG